MMRRSHCLVFAASAAAAILLFACVDARAEQELRVSGTGTALGALHRLAGTFERANPGHRLHVLPSVGSSGAIGAVADGALDVAISGRPLRAPEQARGLVAVPYARTPFVFAVGPRGGVSGISAGELVRIYRGELTTWPSGERVRPILRPSTDVDDEILRAISPEMASAVESAHRREGMVVALTNQECNETLARTPGSIGPTSLTQILTEEKPVVPLAWNGVAPTVANLASGAYPLVKTLVAVVRASPSPPVRRFLAFLGSPEAREILERTGNLPLPMRLPGQDDAGRP
jgi:phosphate transport system substrate-binding protein